MSASERNNRRADKAEQARHITTEETVAFMTALVAFLKDAEAAGHHGGDAQPAPTDLPPPMPQHGADPAPAETTPGARQPVSDDRHADAAPTGETSTMLDADGVREDVAHADASIDVAATTDSPVGAPVSPAVVTSTLTASDHLSGAGARSTHTDAATSTSVDPASTLQELGSTITNLVDTSLSAISHTLDSLSTTVGQLTSMVSGTIGQLTDSVTGLVGGLLHSVGGETHDASSPDLFTALVTDIVSTPLTSPHDNAATHDVAIGGLDTAGAVPMAALPPLTMHLGFLGQPSDGHDLHDGAFSALGVHHF